MLAALEQGLTLLSCGMANVWITDIRGHKRTPAEFSRVVFEGRGQEHGATLFGSARAASA